MQIRWTILVVPNDHSSHLTHHSFRPQDSLCKFSSFFLVFSLFGLKPQMLVFCFLFFAKVLLFWVFFCLEYTSVSVIIRLCVALYNTLLHYINKITEFNLRSSCSWVLGLCSLGEIHLELNLVQYQISFHHFCGVIRSTSNLVNRSNKKNESQLVRSHSTSFVQKILCPSFIHPTATRKSIVASLCVPFHYFQRLTTESYFTMNFIS